MLPRLFIWFLPLILAACVARAPQAPAPFDLASVSPRHRAAFVGLLEALENQENQAAEDILARLIPQLELELEEQEGAKQTEVRWQVRAAKRFERILKGRARMASLIFQLELHGDRAPRSLILTIKNRWPAPMELRPGPAILSQQALLIGPNGEGAEMASSRAFLSLEEMELPPLGTLTVNLGPHRASALGGALGLRETLVLRMGAGGLLEGGELYPAQTWPEASCMQIQLAAFLPNGVLAPSELVRQVETGQMGMSALVERAIRIAPERYRETLLGLRGPVGRATPEMFSRMEPLLRWFCSHDPRPSGLEAWREHLFRLSQG
ncbi:MAG: hypothetical protein GY930_16100 [bacterium]|nr:hypothetical protein [bacterium]